MLVHCGGRVEKPPAQPMLRQVGTAGRVGAKAEVIVGTEEKPTCPSCWSFQVDISTQGGVCRDSIL